MKRNFAAVTTIVGLALTGMTSAATLTRGVVDVLGSQNTAGNPGGELVPVNVSVNSANQGWYGAYPDGDGGYSAPATGSFVGTIQAYRFFQTAADNTIADLASSGSIIGTPVWTLATVQD